MLDPFRLRRHFYLFHIRFKQQIQRKEDIFVIIYNQYFPVLHIPGIILSRVKIILDVTKICIIYTECMCDTAHNLCEITRFSYTYKQANSNILRMFGIHIAFSCIISIFITTCQYVMILYTRMFEASTSGVGSVNIRV